MTIIIETKNKSGTWEFRRIMNTETDVSEFYSSGIPFDVSKESVNKIKEANFKKKSYYILPTLRGFKKINPILIRDIEIEGILAKTDCDQCVRAIFLY